MTSEEMYVLGALELSGASVALGETGAGYDFRVVAGRNSVDLIILLGEYQGEDCVGVAAPTETPAAATR
jgi:hypothetical protein